jgi:hypothetical protein
MYVQAKITTDLGRAERRSEPRHSAGTDVALHKHGQDALDARLINISSRGFMAESDVEVEKGSRIWLTIPGVPRLHARVTWSIGGRFGGEFAQPIDPLAVLVAIGKAGSQA